MNYHFWKKLGVLFMLFCLFPVNAVFAQPVDNKPLPGLTSTQPIVGECKDGNQTVPCPCVVNNSTSTLECNNTTLKAGFKSFTFFTPCELFFRATNLSTGALGDGKWKKYICTELVSPMPLTFFKSQSSTSKTLCLSSTVSRLGDGVVGSPTSLKLQTISINAATSADLDKLCHAIAQESGGGFEGLLSFFIAMFAILQPILITAGVLSIGFYGIKIMFSASGPEDSLKQMIKHGESILLGFVLLFCIKLILLTINSIFFS